MNKFQNAQFFIIPFLIGAAIQFLPAWVWIPAVFLMTLQWGGLCMLIVKHEQEKELLKKEADDNPIIMP